MDSGPQWCRDGYRVASVPEKEKTTVTRRIADELGVREGQVTAAVELLDGGATVPFVARYRKEITGALDDAQLRTLEERLRYLRELDERRVAVLESVRAQGKLDPALEAQILEADSKARLEDIYLPYKPKRRTRAQIAREMGLEPLADLLLGDPATDPAAAAEGFVTAEVVDGAAALEGARAILAERFGEDADLVGELREQMWSRGRAVSRVREGKEQAGAKFADYFEFTEPLTKLPSHRILALFRGEKEEVLDLELDPADDLLLVGSGSGPGPGPGAVRGADGGAVRGRRPGPAGGPVAGRDGPLGLADPAVRAARPRPARPAAAAGRGRGDPGVRQQPARPAAGRAGRSPADARARPGPAYRGEGRGDRRHRQGRRDRHDLPARAAPAVGRRARVAGPAGPGAQGRAGRDRQRHRVPGDRQAGRRADRRQSGAAADQDRRVRGRGLGLLGLGVRVP